MPIPDQAPAEIARLSRERLLQLPKQHSNELRDKARALAQ
jgi:hypothetical protein